MWGNGHRDKAKKSVHIIFAMQVWDLPVRRHVRHEKAAPSFVGLRSLCAPGQAKSDGLPRYFGNQSANYGQ